MSKGFTFSGFCLSIFMCLLALVFYNGDVDIFGVYASLFVLISVILYSSDFFANLQRKRFLKKVLRKENKS